MNGTAKQTCAERFQTSWLCPIVEWRAKQRDAITAPLLGAHPRAEKTNHDTPPSLTQFGKPRNFKEAEARLSRIACR